MSLLPIDPGENLLPYDGILNDFGLIVDQPQQCYDKLLVSLPWQSDVITVFGKTHITERQVVWMGDNVRYRYSGHERLSIPWTEEVFHVKRLVEDKLSDSLKNLSKAPSFNACLLNYYPNGSSGMGYHADDEPELGEQPLIACVSLGTSRKFSCKHKQHKQTISMWLENGQLIVMRGETQNYWQHTISKSKKITDGRISLTFRYIHDHYR